MEKGTKVILLEDVATTGGSLIRAADSIREKGGEIVTVFTIVDREEGATETLSEAGYGFRSLFKVGELL